ncbi:hypothetical protein H5410_031766 [Solanum commersonii]|uniref:superoxide dismutase n=1 Tax=Solanum commersonii TaxID=4109 RepID=A0A9J5YMN8_SOLCO|nr:hypothetical protein H5410_031766 [Solanum commersonii]
MAATASANSLTSAFLPPQGLNGSSKSLQWRTQTKQFGRKSGSATITAKFDLNSPPYPMDALEPHMSSRTFEFHWGKHHRAYVDNLNKQIEGTELDGKTLEDIILVTYNKGAPLSAFNNAAQAWNHQFFWESMKPNGGGEPSGELLELINRDFGSYDTFVKEFKAAAATQFGSGWAWLAYKPEDKKLALAKTPNAENPLVLGYTPLLTIDVWEHAYYLDFQDALEPHMSSRTLEIHWGKHHRAYVDNLNKQIDGTELHGKTLKDILLITYNNGSPLPAFNNAAQAWNHQFFWESMKPNGGGEPSGELLELINRDFGSYDTFVKEFKAAAATQFGSGWAWLAYKPEDKKLALVKTPNAENPLVLGYTPLLTIDVWEHAYYLDFQNRRPDYISVFMEKLISWEAVSSRLKAAIA